MSKILRLENGIQIEKGLCSCLKCSINIKLIGLLVNNACINNNNVSITHDKVYALIVEYGIAEYGKDYIKINTNELCYYIYK